MQLAGVNLAGEAGAEVCQGEDILVVEAVAKKSADGEFQGKAGRVESEFFECGVQDS